MKSFALRFPNGKSKAMTFSYDDGISSDLKLIQLMKKYGIKGTFNINTIFYDGENEPDNRLKKDEIRAISNDPQFEIACHGHTHPHYTFLPQSVVTDDITTNRKKAEEITDNIIRGFAYPYGPFNKKSEEAIKAAGIVYARTIIATKKFELPENWLQWHPTCHHKDSLELYERFAGINRSIGYPCVMYVWGHTYEFEPTHNDNWNLIETLFERCHNNPDIWFATNIEIYDYVNAFNNLVFSLDGEKVHNPSNIDLFAQLDGNWSPNTGRTVSIPAGATINLYEQN